MIAKIFPELKGSDTVTEKCGRCFGNGNVGYGNVNSYHYRVGAAVGSCFDCLGRGTVSVKVSSVRARVRREEKRAEATRIAAEKWAEGEAAREAERIAAEAAAAAKAEAERIAHEAVPAIAAGRYEIEGEIVGTRADEKVFGYSHTVVYKIMVKDVEGRKFWGSLPKSIADEIYDRWLAAAGYTGDYGRDFWLRSAKGATVKFTATVEVSDSDHAFGFYSRPTKASVVSYPPPAEDEKGSES